MAIPATPVCNKTLHKDCITFLGGYPAAVATISSQLQMKGDESEKKVDAWNKRRIECLAALKKLDVVCEEYVKKFDDTKKTCEKSKGDPKFGPAAVSLAQAY